MDDSMLSVTSLQLITFMQIRRDYFLVNLPATCKKKFAG